MGSNLSYLRQIEVVGLPFPEQCIKSTFHMFCMLLERDMDCRELTTTGFVTPELTMVGSCGYPSITELR